MDLPKLKWIPGDVRDVLLVRGPSGHRWDLLWSHLPTPDVVLSKQADEMVMVPRGSPETTSPFQISQDYDLIRHSSIVWKTLQHIGHGWC